MCVSAAVSLLYFSNNRFASLTQCDLWFCLLFVFVWCLVSLRTAAVLKPLRRGIVAKFNAYFRHWESKLLFVCLIGRSSPMQQSGKSNPCSTRAVSGDGHSVHFILFKWACQILAKHCTLHKLWIIQGYNAILIL